jgi:hypothetical protein
MRLSQLGRLICLGLSARHPAAAAELMAPAPGKAPWPFSAGQMTAKRAVSR